MRTSIEGSIREFVGYSLASGGALLCDLIILTGLVEIANVHYLFSAAVSFSIGTLFAYLLCVRYVFASRRIADPKLELTIFWCIGVAGLIVNMGAMSAFVELAGLHYVSAKLGAAAISFMTNFALRKLWLFTISRPLQTANVRKFGANR